MSEWNYSVYGNYPATWNIAELAEISELITDGSHTSPKPQSAGKMMCSVKDMTYNKFDFSQVKYINEEDYQKLVDQGCKPHQKDLLVSKDGANCLDLLFINNQKEDFVLLSSIAIVRLNNTVIPEYIRYFLLSPATQYILRTNFISGSAIPRVVLKDFKRVEILLPPLPEQKAIAAVLSSLDDKIDLLHRQNKTLEAMAETLFRQWFVEEADERWEAVKLGDYIETNVSSIPKEFPFFEIRYLDTGSLNEGKIDELQHFNLADAPSRAKRIVKHNDVLISTVRPNQKHYGIIKNPEDDIIVSTGFCVITCKKLNPHFVYTFLTNNDMTEYLHSIAEGSTSAYPSLKPSDIENLEFQMPPQEKLKAFSDYTDNAWDKIEYNHKQIINLEKLRDSLLPKLMSGEVRVKV